MGRSTGRSVNRRWRCRAVSCLVLALPLISGCGLKIDGAYAIKATVSGLVGTGLELEMNGHDPVTVTSDGEVILAYMVTRYHYSVTVKTQPSNPTQTCTVTNATGVMGTADVANISVSCSVNAYLVKGTVTGLQGLGLKLKLNDQEILPVSGATFEFQTKIANGAPYTVTVDTQPTNPYQICSVSGSGTMGDSDVTNVAVTCSTSAHTVGGTVTGLAAGNTVVLQNNATDDLTVTGSASSNSVSFTFTLSVAEGAAYAVTVKTQPTNPPQPCEVKNGSGTMPTADVISVTVICHWGDAKFVAGQGRHPDIAIDSAGNAIAVWQTHDGTRFNIWSARYDAANAKWVTAQLIEKDDGNVEGPRLAVDSAGNAFATWAGAGGAWINRFDATSMKWGEAQLFVSAANNMQMVMNASGNAFAVWQQSDGTRNNIWANRYDAASGSWGAASPIDDSSNDASYPHVAVNASGNAVVVWQQTIGTSDRSIWANWYDAALARWGTVHLVDADVDELSQVAMDSAGNAIVLWKQSTKIWARRYDAANAKWDKVQLIEAAGDASRIVTNSTGNAFAVWEGLGGIWGRRYDAVSAEWGKAQFIGINSACCGHWPQVAMDSTGNAVAVWAQGDDSSHANSWANRYDAASAKWGTAQPIGTDTNSVVQYPRVAMDASGNAFAVWEQVGGTFIGVWANHY